VLPFSATLTRATPRLDPRKSSLGNGIMLTKCIDLVSWVEKKINGLPLGQCIETILSKLRGSFFFWVKKIHLEKKLIRNQWSLPRPDH
jgi:hypothetical protein